MPGRTGWVKALWLVVAGLGLVYLVVWQVTKLEPADPSASPTVQTTADQTAAGLARKAEADALSRVAGATFEQSQIKPGFFRGDLLESVRGPVPGATAGFEIVLTAKVNDKPTARLTYHAVPPDKVVFVKQEPAR